MNSKLALRYEYSGDDNDDFGWLIAAVETPNFKGRNGMWVQWQDVGEFATALSTYPVQADSPVVREWGFGKEGEYTQITKVSIAPKGLTGALVVDVSLADYYEPVNRCITRFDTDYPSLDRFREAIERMMSERTGEAVLEGSANDS